MFYNRIIITPASATEHLTKSPTNIARTSHSPRESRKCRCPLRAHQTSVAAESFWSTFKTEFYDRYHWATKAEAKTAQGAGSRNATTAGDGTPIGMLTSVRFEEHQLQGTNRLNACPPSGVNLSRSNALFEGGSP